MNREVMDAIDHRFLNKEVPEFVTQIPTTENLAIAIWQRLATKLQSGANCIVCGFMKPPISLSISMEKHESPPDPALYVLRFASPAQPCNVGRLKMRATYGKCNNPLWPWP